MKKIFLFLLTSLLSIQAQAAILSFDASGCVNLRYVGASGEVTLASGTNPLVDDQVVAGSGICETVLSHEVNAIDPNNLLPGEGIRIFSRSLGSVPGIGSASGEVGADGYLAAFNNSATAVTITLAFDRDLALSAKGNAALGTSAGGVSVLAETIDQTIFSRDEELKIFGAFSWKDTIPYSWVIPAGGSDQIHFSVRAFGKAESSPKPNSIWTGTAANDPNWTVAANWTVVPANGNMLTFNSSGNQQTTSFNNLSNTELENIGLVTFDGGNYIVTGNTLKLNSGIFATNSTTSTWGIDSTINTSGVEDLNLTCNNTSTLIVAGTISGANGITASIAGGSTLMLKPSSGKNTFVGNLTVTGIPDPTQPTTLILFGLNDGGRPAGAGDLIVSGGTTVAAETPNVFGKVESASKGSGSLQSVHLDGSTLSLGANDTQLSKLVLSKGATVTATTGTLDIREINNTDGSVKTPSLIQVGASTTPSAISAKINLTASGNFSVNSDASLLVSGIINGGGNLNKSGEGLMQLSSANTFTGETIVNNGTLELVAGGNLATGCNVVTGLTGTFKISAGLHTLGNLTGTGTTQVLGSLTVTSIVQDTLVIGAPPPLPTTTVPEPGSLILLAFAASMAMVVRKKFSAKFSSFCA